MAKPTTKKQIEHRTSKGEFRVASDSGKNTIYGYAAKYGVRSSDLGGWVEVIAPGAFDASLATNPDVVGLFNHDQSAILGRTSAGTMRISSDDTGLSYEIDPPDTQVARDLMTSMQRGDVFQSSFGFRCNDAAWSYDEATGMEVRTVKQADIFDCSPVVSPAYPDATSGVRSLPADMPIEVRSRLTKVEHRDDPDADPSCSCDCGQCQAGSCSLCSDSDCDDEYCSSCPMGEENRNWRLNTELRLRTLRKG